MVCEEDDTCERKETKSDLIGLTGSHRSVFKKNERLRLHRRKLEKILTGDDPFPKT